MNSKVILIAAILVMAAIVLPASAVQNVGSVDVQTMCHMGFQDGRVSISMLNGTQAFDTYNGKVQPDVAATLKVIPIVTIPQRPDGTVPENVMGNGQYLVALTPGQGMQTEYAVVTVSDGPSIARFQGQAVSSD